MMPVDNRSTKAQVTFALAVVKSSVIRNRAESSRIQAALQLISPGVSVILVAEDDALESHRCHNEIVAFAKDGACAVIPSSRITLNRVHALSIFIAQNSYSNLAAN
jgi:hypothetical protein